MRLALAKSEAPKLSPAQRQLEPGIEFHGHANFGELIDAYSGAIRLDPKHRGALQLYDTVPMRVSAKLGTTHLMAGVEDFADTAVRLAGLDLIILVDTAMAHLAATQGNPVWLLSRHAGCWRWLSKQADSAWYPTLRIVRQTRVRDWSETIAEVRQDLVDLASETALRTQ